MHRQSMKRPFAFFWATAALVLAGSAGCSDGRPDRVPVSGQVLIDGKPLPDARLAFYPESGRLASGVTDQQGRFTLGCYEENDGVLIGPQKVAVIAIREINSATTEWFAPKKYADVKRSELHYQIDQPTDDLLIELSWNGGKPFIERLTGETNGD